MPVKSTVEISQNLVAFLEYMNFKDMKLVGKNLLLGNLSKFHFIARKKFLKAEIPFSLVLFSFLQILFTCNHVQLSSYFIFFIEKFRSLESLAYYLFPTTVQPFITMNLWPQERCYFCARPQFTMASYCYSATCVPIKLFLWFVHLYS